MHAELLLYILGAPELTFLVVAVGWYVVKVVREPGEL
jgi:hypothetical protein